MSDYQDALDRLLAGFYNSQALSPGNPGGLAADGHVTNFPAALKDVGLIADLLSGWMEILPGADLLGVAGSLSEVQQAQVALENPLARENLVTSNYGDKLSDLIAGMKNSRRSSFYLDEDIAFDIQHSAFATQNLTFQPQTGRKTITVLDASNLPGRVSGFAPDFVGSYTFSNIDFVFNTTSSLALIETRGLSKTQFFNCTFSGMQGEFLLWDYFYRCPTFGFWSNSPIVPGQALLGVDAGVDPKTVSNRNYFVNLSAG